LHLHAYVWRWIGVAAGFGAALFPLIDHEKTLAGDGVNEQQPGLFAFSEQTGKVGFSNAVELTRENFSAEQVEFGGEPAEVIHAVE